MIKHFIGILLGMTSMAHAMDDPKDDDSIVFTQTPAQALEHRALVEAIENQPDPGPTHYDAGRDLYYLEDPRDDAEASESSKEVSLKKPGPGPMYYDEDRDLYYFHPRNSDTPEDFPKAFDSSDTVKIESSKVTAAAESTASGVKPAASPAPAAIPQTTSDDDDETTETLQDTIQWLYDNRLNKSYYLSDDFIDTEDAAETAESSKAAAATASTTADVKPTVESTTKPTPAPADTPQTRSDNKKPYFPIPQYDPDTGVWFISLIPEKSHRRPEPTTKPEASDIKTAPTVSPKTESDDDDDKE